MSVSSYIVDFQAETLAVKFQAQVCVNQGKDIRKTGTVVEDEKFRNCRKQS